MASLLGAFHVALSRINYKHLQTTKGLPRPCQTLGIEISEFPVVDVSKSFTISVLQSSLP